MEESCFYGDQQVDVEDLIENENNTTVIENFEKIAEIVRDLLKQKNTSKDQVREYLKKKSREYHIQAKQTDVLAVYRELCSKGEFEYDVMYESLLQRKPFRSQSGVMVIAVFTAPYPNYQKNGEQVTHEFSCKYDCYYCPAEPGQPRSYLLKEPGVLRANQNNFITTEQFWSRADTYYKLGHPVDKIELIVLGGTWSSYPIEYQKEFIRDCFYAANTYSDPNRKINRYDKLREKKSLEEEQKINETSDCHIIGLTLETRPDCINKAEIIRYRQYGVTRVQIGVQHTDDDVLYRVNRQCTDKIARRAIRILKDNCFKVIIHVMPGLPEPLKPGVDNKKPVFEKDDIDFTVDMYERDRNMMTTVIRDPEYDPDEIKVYPCSIVPFTRIEQDYKMGIYKPYTDSIITLPDGTIVNPLVELAIEFKSQVPESLRICRFIRDIPNDYLIGGNKNVNLRQLLETEMKKRNLKCRCIRCREVKKRSIDSSNAVLKVTQSADPCEYFLQFTTPDGEILFGFLRLRLSSSSGMIGNSIVFPELENTALIRELHVYGDVIPVNSTNTTTKVQHTGMGTRLIEKAIEMAKENGFPKVAVISGVGVRNYYRRKGFVDEGFYLTRPVFD